MRFALLGDHPDAFDVSHALVETGRHQLVSYSGPATGLEMLARFGSAPKRFGDVEEIFADPSLDAIIVAGSRSVRAAQLRRALQSEHHALSVHPLADSPDAAYEASMLQADTHMVLMPLMPEALHPALRRLRELLQKQKPDVALIQLIEMERWSEEEILLEADVFVAADSKSPPDNDDLGRNGADGAISAVQTKRGRANVDHGEAALPGWDVLRLLGGEIAEVVALAKTEELRPGEPILLSGRFELGGLFRSLFLPRQAESLLRISVLTSQGRLVLAFPQGWPGPAELTYEGADGRPVTERWEALNPWQALVEAWESVVGEGWRAAGEKEGIEQEAISQLPLHVEATQYSPSDSPITIHQPPSTSRHAPPATRHPIPTWQDATRALELDDAVRRSVARRRASTLDNLEVTEEASFKGTMTLVGCGLLWLCLVLFLFSVLIPWLAWLIIPIIAIFLVMQSLKWFVPAKEKEGSEQH